MNQNCPSPHLKQYNLFSWEPDGSRSPDENYMDIVMFLTRSSQLRQGSMGCIIVKPDQSRQSDQSKKDEGFDKAEFFNSIIGASTNQSLFNHNDSDIHAEIATLGECLQHGRSTKDCTIFITMPPCKRCFGAIVSAGIKRIVSNRDFPEIIQDGAKARNIELVSMDSALCYEQQNRINNLIRLESSAGETSSVSEERKRRKDERKRRKKIGEDELNKTEAKQQKL